MGEELGLGKVFFSSDAAWIRGFSEGTFGVEGIMKSGLPPVRLFNTASSLETASKDDVALWIRSSSRESSMLKVAGVASPPDAGATELMAKSSRV